jgi:hypothetical protein
LVLLPILGAAWACGSNGSSGGDDGGSLEAGPVPEASVDAPLNEAGLDAAMADSGEGGEAGEGGPTCGWRPFADGLDGASIVSVLFDTRAPGVAYAASATSAYRSSDSGRTWTRRGDILSGAFVQLALSGPTAGALLAATSDGLVRSADGGTSWQTVSLGGINVQSLTVSPSQPLRVYAGTFGAGAFRSDDGALSWIPVTAGYPAMDTLALDVNPANPDEVVAAGFTFDTSGNPNGGAIVRTTNGGQTWQTTLQSAQYVWNIQRCSKTSSVMYAASNGGLYASADGGANWSPTAPGFVADVAISAADCNTVYMNVYGVGPELSTDGGKTFSAALTTGLTLTPQGTSGGRMVVDPQAPGGVVLGSHGGIWYTSDSGAHWKASEGLLGLDVRRIDVSPQDPARAWASTWGSGVWTRPAPTQPWQRAQLVADFAFSVRSDPFVNNRIFAGTFLAQSGLYESTDGATFASGALAAGTNVFDLGFDPASALTLYAASQTGGVYKSVDGAKTWGASNGGLTPWVTPAGTFIDVRLVVVDPAEEKNVYIGTSGRGVYKSTDGGASWANVLDPAGTTTCLELAPGPPSTLVACVTGSGVQASQDGGVTWTTLNEGLPSLDVDRIAVDRATGDLYATIGAGVYQRKQGAASAWTGLDVGCLPGKAATSPAVVTQGQDKWLIVGAAGSIYGHPI